MENNKSLSRSEEEEIEQYLTELGKSLHKFKKYYDYNDPDYKRIRDIENGEVNEKDYYKPRKSNNSTFDGS